jgi:DNA repair protein RadA/Sms
MKKLATGFVCQNCSYLSSKWLGKCSNCGQWNSFIEEHLAKKANHSSKQNLNVNDEAQALSEIGSSENKKLQTGIQEFDRVLGGGLTLGSLVLLGGEPGIGKSTLLSMVLGKIDKEMAGSKVLYVSGEESREQVAARMNRIGIQGDSFFIYHETSWQLIKEQIIKLKPKFLVIDSIQTTVSVELDSLPGSVSQIREVTHEIMNFTKSKGITTFLIGHITKEGNIAGPKILEHMVDTVIYFEGDELGQYRLIRAIKNRFGTSNEVGIFEMSSAGLREVNNPSQIFLNDHTKGSFGSTRTCMIEGSRTLMLEVQALVVENKQGCGRRTTQGIEGNRLSMLVAIIEKYFSMSLGFSDVYLNIVGGIKVTARESDLSVLAAILSSIYKKAVPREIVFLGEVGLSGEVRSMSQVEKRLKELEHLGYKEVFTSNKVREKYSGKTSLRLQGMSHARDLLSLFS